MNSILKTMVILIMVFILWQSFDAVRMTKYMELIVLSYYVIHMKYDIE